MLDRTCDCPWIRGGAVLMGRRKLAVDGLRQGVGTGSVWEFGLCCCCGCCWACDRASLEDANPLAPEILLITLISSPDGSLCR